MRVALLLLLLLLPACESTRAGGKAKIKTARAVSEVPPLPVLPSQQAAPSMAARFLTATGLIPQEDTNDYFRISFRWEHPDPFASFILAFGTNKGGPYPVTIDLFNLTTNNGTTNFFTLSRTNWPEDSLRHFFVIRAVKDGQESTNSLEVFWPPYPPDHVRISWPGAWPTVSLFSSPDLSIPLAKWPRIITVTGTNRVELLIHDGPAFFVTDKPDTLSIEGFNPLNTTY